MAKQITHTFGKQLKLALKRFSDPVWLGENSVLASLYFLGGELAKRPYSPQASGQALQNQIRLAAYQLWGGTPQNREEIEQALDNILQEPGSPRYSYLVLELRYLRQFFKPRRLSDIWEKYLGESRAEFYRDVDRAVEQLGETLLQNIRPVVRLERPILPTVLIGRETTQTQALRLLRNGESVSLSGAGGVGKSSLGATLAQSWGIDRAFWFTVQPFLNDDANSLLFALAHFLHEQGHSLLWQKLVAENGRIDDLTVILGLLRADLADAQMKLLFCLDEVDRLQPPQSEFTPPRHQQLIELIEQLKENAPLLLIGQRAIIDTQHHFPLRGVTEENLTAWFAAANIAATSRQIGRLWRYTGGNPRLIRLALALIDEETSLAAVLAEMPTSPTLHPLFARLWARTTLGERAWLEGLSVYRLPMPLDVWLGETADLQSLLARQLILDDGQGGLTMWPALRDMVYQEMTLEQREQRHLQAAVARAERGEYTAAAYHFWKGNQPKTAVHVWYPQRQREIEKGQGQAALSIFQNISFAQLGKREKEALSIIRAELYQLEGNLAQATQEIEQVSWKMDQEVSVQAKLLHGFFKNNLGYQDGASKSYNEGIEIIARLQKSLVTLRTRRGHLYVKLGELDKAWREMQQAQVQATHLKGLIHLKKGEYEQALAAQLEALGLAEAIEDAPSIAQSHFEIARLMTHKNDLAGMIHHTEKAQQIYQEMGNLFHSRMAQINLSAVFIQTKQFEKAAETAKEIIPFFEKMGNPYAASISLTNLAEAQMELNQLDEAEQTVHRVLSHEEPHSMPYALFTLAMVNKKRHNPAAALQALDYSAEFARKNEDIFLLAYIHRGKAEVHHGSHNQPAAQKEAQTALSLFEKLGIESEIEATRQLLESISNR